MSVQWIDRSPERPDRYLDWDAVNRSAQGDDLDGWCSVLVQTAVAGGQDPAQHLKELRDKLPRPGSPTPAPFNATADELDLIDARIAEIEGGTLVPTGPDDPRLSFFVYMRETDAYANGDFNHQPPIFRIRLAGPPMPELPVERPTAPAPVPPQMPAPAAIPPQSVAVGIIDSAIAFANERFRTRDGAPSGGVDRSRIRQLWIQSVEHTDSTSGTVVLGQRLDAIAIDGALQASAQPAGVINEDALYAATGAVSFAQEFQQATARHGGHGTHVADLACGYDVSDMQGSRRPVLAVQLPEPAKLKTSSVTTASYALQGLRQILRWADTISPDGPLPLVVNFSYGYFAGPKDGYHPFVDEMHRLVASRQAPSALVLPAGNTYLARVTAEMSLGPNAADSLDWILLPDGGTPSFLEIWLDNVVNPGDVSLQISIPGSGPQSVPMPANRQAKLLAIDGKTIGGVYFDSRPYGQNRSRIFVAVNPTKSFQAGYAVAPSGAYGVTIENKRQAAISARLVIQRQDTPAGAEPKGRQSYFAHPNAYARDPATANYDALGTPSSPCPITHSGTLTEISTTLDAVIVGAVFAEKDGIKSLPTLYTSAGPVPARPGPDFAAVGDEDRALPGVIAAGTRSGSFAIFQGTSIAAPQLTRYLADAGARLATLKANLGIASGAQRDARTGWAAVSAIGRAHIPPRRKP